jgi:hypothetical protein
MRETHHATVAVPSAVRYAAVAVGVLLGFLALLVAAAHPVPVGTAVGGAVASVAAGRARRRVESHLRRPAADGDDLSDSSPV